MRRAAGISLVQVKQCANIAVARNCPLGISKRAASGWPEWPINVTLLCGIAVIVLRYITKVTLAIIDARYDINLSRACDGLKGLCVSH